MNHNFHAEEQFIEADELIKEKKISEALTLLKEIITEYPDFGKAYNHMGWIYETKMNDLVEAEKCYKLAIKFMPNYRASYYNYAIVLSTQRRFDELKALLEQAAKVPGINMGTLYNEYAIMYESQGEYDKAIDHYLLYLQQLFDATTIDNVVTAIERCKKKRDLLKL